MHMKNFSIDFIVNACTLHEECLENLRMILATSMEVKNKPLGSLSRLLPSVQLLQSNTMSDPRIVRTVVGN